jgi:SAM-dependent methyltransferase
MEFERGSAQYLEQAIGLGQMHDFVVAPEHCRGARVPWWVKIAAKVALSRMPLSHSAWSWLNIFRHSYTSDDPLQQVLALEGRIKWYRARTGRVPDTVLEIGPGENTTCAVIYKALGVRHVILLDVGDFGTREVEAYRRVADAAAQRSLTPSNLDRADTREEIFRRCGAEYHVGGIADLRRLPTAGADLVLSLAVVEHIRRRELAPTFNEMRRVMKDDAIACHWVDFQDHLGGKLANLRFSPAIWESEFMALSGFYTNRVSPSQLIAILDDAGLKVEIENRGVWTQPAATRARIARQLRADWTDEDLRVCSMSIIATVRDGASRVPDAAARIGA